MTEPTINPIVLRLMEANPETTLDELRADPSIAHLADNTLKTQRSRIRSGMGLAKVRKPKPKKKKRDLESNTSYKDSLTAMTDIPRTAFVSTEDAAVATNGNKLHVNLHTAREAELNKIINAAEAWVAWLKSVETAQVGDDIDFLAWINQTPRHADHRKEKLLRRWREFDFIHTKLSIAMESVKQSSP